VLQTRGSCEVVKQTTLKKRNVKIEKINDKTKENPRRHTKQGLLTIEGLQD
jgi:hypothetical protein